jgi:flagellar biosynthesis/type III secretory pathway chaperone
MSEAFGALVEALRSEAEVLEALVVLAHAEGEALVAVDHEALRESIVQQDDYVARLTRLDRERAAVATALSVELGLDPNANLLSICEHLPDTEASEGRNLHEEIRYLAGEIAHLNRENDVLVRQALHQTQHSITLLSGIARQEERKETYGPAGHGGRRRGSSVLDRLV